MSTPQNRWIWPFELLDKLGEGGMGEVYRARYVKNDRQVAVKILPGDVSDPIILGRFDRELEILRKLRHPNIVHCFGGTTEGKHRYYAMEIVEGGGFDRLLAKRGQLPWELSVRYAQQMAAALQHAHEAGVTHRDVKPGNFLIGPTGQLKLSDFGLATFAAARNLTAAGKTMGTFRYMAPEQIRGKEVGPQSDLYSLGCVMFEMLTGKPPFDGATPAEILDQHLHKEAPRVSSIALDCPASLDQLVSSLLKKDAAQRPASAAAVAQALSEVSQVVMVTTNPIQDAHKTAEVAIPKPKSELSVWTLPSWVVVALAVVPLALIAWAFSLQSRAREADQAIDYLEEMWQSSSPDGPQKVAAVGLGRIARYNERALKILADGLNSSDEHRRRSALIGLAEAGRAAIDYKDEVFKLQKEDVSPMVRPQAQATIDAIDRAEPVGGTGKYWMLVLIGCALLGGYFVTRKIKTAAAGR